MITYTNWVLQLEFFCDIVYEIKGENNEKKKMIKEYEGSLKRMQAQPKEGYINPQQVDNALAIVNCSGSQEWIKRSSKKAWNKIVASQLFNNEKFKMHYGELTEEGKDIEAKIVELEGQRKLSKHYKKLEPRLEVLHGD